MYGNGVIYGFFFITVTMKTQQINAQLLPLSFQSNTHLNRWMKKWRN